MNTEQTSKNIFMYTRLIGLIIIFPTENNKINSQIQLQDEYFERTKNKLTFLVLWTLRYINILMRILFIRTVRVRSEKI